MSTERLTCQDCRFWEEHEPEDWIGICRRHAPTALTRITTDDGKLPLEVEARWPMTTNEDWCGDFSPTVPPERPAASS
jgi:hypothetical protein